MKISPAAILSLAVLAGVPEPAFAASSIAGVMIDYVTVGNAGNAADSDTTGVDSAPNELAADSGAAYVFTRSGTVWTQQAYLKASNTGAGDQFGVSVAVSGETVVVGANAEDSSATGVDANPADNSAPNSGSAYVFVRTGTMWTQQAYLKASNTGVGDLFGYSVAASGDTVVVGAASEQSSSTGVGGNQADDSAAKAGAAYVFTRIGTVWTQQAYLKASNTGAGDHFGISVALSNNTAVVGAFYEDSSTIGVNSASNEGAANSGAAYVFTRTGTTWTQEAYLKASNTGPGDWFGVAVAVSDDMVVVGAYAEDSDTTGVNRTPNELSAESGAAYVFKGLDEVLYAAGMRTDASSEMSAAQAGQIFRSEVMSAGLRLVEVGCLNHSGAQHPLIRMTVELIADSRKTAPATSCFGPGEPQSFADFIAKEMAGKAEAV